MDDLTYQIYYLGLKPGVTVEQAASLLEKLLKTTPEKAERMILSTNRAIKNGLGKAQADRYFNALDKIGMIVEIRGTEGEVIEAEREIALEPKAVTETRSEDEAHKEYQNIDVEFKGKGFEYFKIWIVNIFLTIVTLGIYSAWAKVRNNQYFYGNTYIDGSSFQYTAKPITILKGRLIAVAVFILYSVLTEFMPIAGLVLGLLILMLFPWLIIRSLMFNARNSMFRNIRFNFTGELWPAVKTFILWPLLLLPTFGLIIPVIWYKQKRFLVTNSAYGTTAFDFNASVKDYFKIFLMVLGVFIGFAVLFGLAVSMLGLNPNDPSQMMTVMPAMTLISMLLYLFMFGYLAAALGNLFYNSTALQQHGFTSTLEAKHIAWIYVTNSLAVLCSLGLLIPWAKVRMAQYRADCLTFHSFGSLDNFVAVEQEKVSALGEQMGEVFDMEVSIV